VQETTGSYGPALMSVMMLVMLSVVLSLMLRERSCITFSA
jgi:hypothetical protein